MIFHVSAHCVILLNIKPSVHIIIFLYIILTLDDLGEVFTKLLGSYNRFGYSNSAKGSTAVNCNLAASLLGGVLDHYSSVFVVQATTQTHQWEDTLRQDLHTTAHRPTFHQPVAEAVAVVADTDSW